MSQHEIIEDLGYEGQNDPPIQGLLKELIDNHNLLLKNAVAALPERLYLEREIVLSRQSGFSLQRPLPKT